MLSSVHGESSLMLALKSPSSYETKLHILSLLLADMYAKQELHLRSNFDKRRDNYNGIWTPPSRHYLMVDSAMSVP